ncbi:hypothetical protein BDV93DRAFT_528499 [Ceratobasidium sp. AG-I]|nr:hypothetical protein BDV93DRAFT_528499 [Ceratobasidium sp. AG-I]
MRSVPTVGHKYGSGLSGFPLPHPRPRSLVDNGHLVSPLPSNPLLSAHRHWIAIQLQSSSGCCSIVGYLRFVVYPDTEYWRTEEWSGSFWTHQARGTQPRST